MPVCQYQRSVRTSRNYLGIRELRGAGGIDDDHFELLGK